MPAAPALFTADDLDRARRDQPDVRVVDVRSPAEFSARHIPGSYKSRSPSSTSIGPS